MGLKTDTAFDLRSQMTKQGNQFNFDGPTIIYCPTKKATNEVAAIVKGIMMVNDVPSGLKVEVSQQENTTCSGSRCIVYFCVCSVLICSRQFYIKVSEIYAGFPF